MADLFGEAVTRGVSANPAGALRAGRDRYLPEARALWAVLSDGHKRLGYNVSRTYCLRDADTRKPIRSSWVDRGTWRPARDVDALGELTDRTLNPFVLQKHLLGKYDVAWQAPSWTSLVVFDIDRHLPGRAPAREASFETVLAANNKRDQTLARLWTAFGFGAHLQPVILQTPSGGYHVYLPLCRRTDDAAAERTWPAAWVRERIEHHLNQAGLSLSPGTLELFPSGVRLRAPCGLGQMLLDVTCPDDSEYLGLVPAPDTTVDRAGTLSRRIGPLVREFCTRLERARRPLDDWLALERPAWHPTWGPFGARDEMAPQTSVPKKQEMDFQEVLYSSQHNVDVMGDGAVALGHEFSGCLLYGKAFVERIRDLSQFGLTEPGQRHDAALKLVWYWGRVRALPKEEVLALLREWLEGFGHVSHTRQRSFTGFVKTCLREAAHYFDRHVRPGQGARASSRTDVALRLLEPEDERWLQSNANLEVRQEVILIFRYLKGFANTSGRVPGAVNLSGQILASMCGERRIAVVEADGVTKRRRATVLAMEELVRLGVLTLHTNYSTGRHGRLYTCWYQFGSGALPKEDKAGRRVLAVRSIEEGILQVVSVGGRVTCELVTSPDTFGKTGAADQAFWWQRMYQRRSFTPAEFFEGDVRKLIPGPFRHRYPSAKANDSAKKRERTLRVETDSIPCPNGPLPRTVGSRPPGDTTQSRTERAAPAIDADSAAGNEFDWKRVAYRSLHEFEADHSESTRQSRCIDTLALAMEAAWAAFEKNGGGQGDTS